MPDGILQDLHRDHEQVSDLIDQLLKTPSSAERGSLFKEAMNMLLAHSRAEQNVLYKKEDGKGGGRAGAELRIFGY
jgi:hemerythrin superfamily protein